MKGCDRFTSAEAEEIRDLLDRVRRAEPGTPQKLLRDQLRALGFYISDWGAGPAGFTRADFDELLAQGSVRISDDAAPPSPPRASSVQEFAASARAALEGPRLSIEEPFAGGKPARPGLYALYADALVWRELGLGDPPDDRPLYVGKAEDSVVSRLLNTHFATGKTGRSSPRRSFAALLVAELQLVAMPRRPANPEPKKWTHYALEEPGDDDLTKWMCTNLQLTVWIRPPGAPLAKVESEVMGLWKPPLNLIGVTTPWSGQVRAARAVLAEQAKQWAQKRH